MSCLKLHIIEENLHNNSTLSNPLKPNNPTPKNHLTTCKPFYKTCTGSYRYGFNGMEQDNELKGNGNSLDFGARIYDPRIGRWLSVDPLRAKYPWQSQYSALDNNPILHKELDGREYAVYVDHKTKTIIIKATYYTKKGNVDDYNSAVKATEFWNKQSGKYQYQVKTVVNKGFLGIFGREVKKTYYDINFELDVHEAENPIKQTTIDYLPEFIPVPEVYKRLTTDRSSNTYKLVPDEELDEDVAGESDGLNIWVKESFKNDENVGAHEIGHTLGFLHQFGTVMAKKLGDGKGISSIVVGRILKNVGIGRTNWRSGPGNGNIQPPKGDAPANFEKGKVKLKKNN